MEQPVIRSFIKGKVTETIFRLMFIEAGVYKVLPFGYENTFPELSQYKFSFESDQILDQLRTTPDFILISNDKTKVYMVEVKYRNHIDSIEILRIANKLESKWGISQLFIATNKKFHFASCKSIIENNGFIPPLEHSWVSEEIQKKYISCLKEYIEIPDTFIKEGKSKT